MAKVLITGITGFAGSHLADFLLTKGIDVYGIKRWRSRTENIDHIIGKVKLLEADIRDSHSIENIIEEVEPDYIFHLAAQSFVPTSWKAPAETMTTNVVSTIHILESVRKSKSNPIVHIAGSSEEYGMVYPNEVPIKETNPLRPLSPYGVSKVAQDKLAYQYNKSYGIKTVLTRAFNHTGPRRGYVFVSSNFAKQIIEIEKGLKEPVIRVGNLDPIRDFTDVRDMVRGYWLAANKCKHGEAYNICSGSGVKIKELLDIMLGFSKRKDIETKKDPARMRPSDVEILIGDSTKFREVTGWKPEIPLEKTMEDLLNYWRKRINPG